MPRSVVGRGIFSCDGSIDVSSIQPASQEEPAPIRPAVKRCISALVVLHVGAVFLAPLSFQTRGSLGSSPSVDTLLMPLRGYGEFLYLNRGYAFFAPDPGPSHLVQAAIGELTDPDLQEPVYPDLDRDWPRLLYHRHFMLAEYLTEIHHPPGPPPELKEQDPAAAELWEASRARYEYVRQSYVRHLRSKNPGRVVAIRRLEHLLPSFLEFDPGTTDLRSEQSYRVMPDQWDPVPMPMAAGAIAPAPAPELLPETVSPTPNSPTPSSPPQPTSPADATESGVDVR